MMQALCIISVSSSSLRVQPSSLAILLKLQKSATPFPWLSQIWNTLVRPSLDLLSPTLEQTISRNSSNLTGLFTYLRPLIISKTIALLPLRPSSSRIFSTSTGSIVPPLSSSKRSKVAFNSSQSWELSLSFQELEVLAAGAGALVAEVAVLLPFIPKRYFLQIKLKILDLQRSYYNPPEQQLQNMSELQWPTELPLPTNSQPPNPHPPLDIYIQSS